MCGIVDVLAQVKFLDNLRGAVRVVFKRAGRKREHYFLALSSICRTLVGNSPNSIYRNATGTLLQHDSRTPSS